MRIIYLNHYAGSPQYGMEFRPYYMAKEWVKKGHQVNILAADYSHVRAKQPITNGKKTIEHIDGVQYQWYPTPSYNGNGIGRVKNIFAFLWQVYNDSNHIINEFSPDVIIASSTYPLDIWVAQRLAKKAKAKLVFEVHDLWPLSPIELGGMSAKHPFIMLCQAAENYAYKHADVVVSMLPKVHEHMASHGLNLEKLHIIPNGIVEEDWQTEQCIALNDNSLLDWLAQQQQKNKVIVAYTGAHGQPNALDYLLDAAKELTDLPVEFMLVGTGLEKQNLINKKEKEHILNVHFFDPIDKSQIPDLLSKVDIVYIGLRNEPLFRYGISPNKLMDYMMAEKPIICAIQAGNDPVSEQNCGFTIEPAKPAAIVSAISKLLELSPSERQAMGQKGRDFILKNQTYTVLAERFLEVMQ